MDNGVLDYILKFLNIDKKDIEYKTKLEKMKRAEKTLDDIVRSKTKNANKYLSDINNLSKENFIFSPVNLALQYYKDPGKIMDSFIAMEYTICGNITNIDDNTKSILYRMVIPDIIKSYNKTSISNEVKIKEGSMFNATVILYQ